MLLTHLWSGIFPAHFSLVFKRKIPANVLSGTWEKFDFNDAHYAFGIERVDQDNPLEGKIIHRSTHQREYFAAMGREEDGSIDFTQPAVLNKLKSIISTAIAEPINADHQMALSMICQLRRSSSEMNLDLLIRDIAENAGNLNEVDDVILAEVAHIDLPMECRNAVTWLQSNLGAWRIQAYFQSEKPLFWPLDLHRHGKIVYSRSGTTPNSIGTVYDEAVWVPSDSLYEEIEQKSLNANPSLSPYDISMRVLDANLAKYNAYLKQQCFQVVKFELDSDNQYIESARSATCFGFDSAIAEKEKLVRQLWLR